MGVRLPTHLLEDIDRRAAVLGRSRASVIRSLLEEALGRSASPDDGIDRAQLHRTLAMTPAQRMHGAVDLAAQQRRFRHAARPGR